MPRKLTATAPDVASSPTPRKARRKVPPPEQLSPWARTLKRLMHERHVSQQQVADATQIDKNTLSALVHGRRDPSHRTLAALAQYFKVPLGTFFNEEHAPLAPSVNGERDLAERVIQMLQPYVALVIKLALAETRVVDGESQSLDAVAKSSRPWYP